MTTTQTGHGSIFLSGEAERTYIRLPHLCVNGQDHAPVSPRTLAETGLESAVLHELAIKLAGTVASLTTQWAGGQLCLAPQLTEAIFWQLMQDRLVEVLGPSGEHDYRYAATERGRQRARELMAISGYIGPAPVSLDAYTEMLDWQITHRANISYARVRTALSSMVLRDEAIEVAALAAVSGRSLLLFGPAGNGKTSLARLLHNLIDGELWIPHCINVESSIIRIYDQHLHSAVEAAGETPGSAVDRRWVKIRPPMVVGGGEMTIAELDLAYSPAVRFYEAPPHLKANGGTFLIDDFGRQHMAPRELLNRWIVPLERQVDYLTLCTGQKIEVPFRQMLIIATNLDVTEVADPAFLRRAGYRLLLDRPSPESYAEIFKRYAMGLGQTVPAGLVGHVLDRYRDEHRELRASEAVDLIERAADICRLHERPLRLDAETLDVAWHAYFSQS